MSESLRILFMGSPEVAVPYLEFLHQSSHNIVGVVTRPDRPAGRGLKVHPCAVAGRARELGLNLYQPESMVDPPFVKTIEELQVDLGIVVAYGKILKEEILLAPRYRCWNVHFSLLPKYRGAAPYQWALINGETKTGVTLIRLVKKMDAGPILGQVECTIDPEDNAETLGDKLARLGVPLLAKSLEALQSDVLIETPQDDEQASFAPLLKKEDGLINWDESTSSLCNHIRGLNPWPAAYSHLPCESHQKTPPGETTRVDKVMLKIYSAEAFECERGANPGTVIKADAKLGLVVACGNGALLIKELQLAGKKRMKATDFLRGHSIPEGIKLL